MPVKKIFLVMIIFSILLISGCITQTGELSKKDVFPGDLCHNVDCPDSTKVCPDGTIATCPNRCNPSTGECYICTPDCSSHDIEPESYGIGDVLSNGQIEMTVHSAIKRNYISTYSDLKEGFTYLIVDFSIKNINLEEGFYFNPNYIEVEDEEHYTFDYSWDSFELDRYFDTCTIDIGRTKRGKLAFEVPKDSKSFTFVFKSSMLDKGLAFVDLGTIENPQEIVSGTIDVDSVDYNWYDYGMVINGKTGTGSIYSANVIIENTGNVAIKPKYDIFVTSYSNTVFSKQDVNSLLVFDIPPGETETDSISLLSVTLDEPGSYTLKVKLKNEGDSVVLSSDSKTINVG